MPERDPRKDLIPEDVLTTRSAEMIYECPRCTERFEAEEGTEQTCPECGAMFVTGAAVECAGGEK